MGAEILKLQASYKSSSDYFKSLLNFDFNMVLVSIF